MPLFSVLLAALPALATAPAELSGLEGGEAPHGHELIEPPLDLPDGPSHLVNAQPEVGYPAAVSLGAGELTACSGSLITPKLVLTAAHCGADLPLETVVALGHAFFGPTHAEAVHVADFEDMYVHPDYQPLVSGLGGTLGANDFGILVLDDPAPRVHPPVWFNTRTLTEEDVGDLVTSVGFGIDNSATGTGSGLKRSAVLTIDELEEMFLISDSDTNDDGANVCSGDSGGPQYHEEPGGRLLQWSVHSWADIDCAYTSGSTRTDLVSEWLLDTVEEVHGSRDVCRVNGHYRDGICDTFCDDEDPDCIEEAKSACGCATGARPGTSLGFLVALVALGRRRRA